MEHNGWEISIFAIIYLAICFLFFRIVIENQVHLKDNKRKEMERKEIFRITNTRKKAKFIELLNVYYG